MKRTIYKAPEHNDDPDFETNVAVGDAALISLAAWNHGQVVLCFGGTEIDGELIMEHTDATRLAKALLDATEVAGCKHFKG